MLSAHNRKITCVVKDEYFSSLLANPKFRPKAYISATGHFTGEGSARFVAERLPSRLSVVASNSPFHPPKLTTTKSETYLGVAKLIPPRRVQFPLNPIAIFDMCPQAFFQSDEYLDGQIGHAFVITTF